MPQTTITTRPYGVRKDGQQVTEYILDNGWMSVSLMDHGAIILGVNVPDKNGRKRNVCLGFDTLAEYEEAKTHNFGSFIGRVANRISNHAFTLDGVTYTLDDNNNSCCLHGGFVRYNHFFYNAIVGKDSVTFTRVSPDGEQGFPGNLSLSVTYTLTEENGLQISYEATTDKATPVGFTNHIFFNLSGDEKEDIKDEELWMENAESYLAVDEVLVPTGIEKTVGTRYDFVSGWKKLAYDGGFDNAFLFHKAPGISRVAVARDNESGITLECYTDQPSLQLYTGQKNHVANGRGGMNYGAYSGFCLETQGYINAINNPSFPSMVLRPGEKYTHFCEYRFV